MPLLSKHLSLHCPVSASVNVNKPLLIFCTNRNYGSYCWKMTYLSYHIATYQLTGQKKKEKNPDPLMLAVKHGMSQDRTLLHTTLPVRRTMAMLDHYLKHVVHEE